MQAKYRPEWEVTGGEAAISAKALGEWGRPPTVIATSHNEESHKLACSTLWWREDNAYLCPVSAGRSGWSLALQFKAAYTGSLLLGSWSYGGPDRQRVFSSLVVCDPIEPATTCIQSDLICLVL